MAKNIDMDKAENLMLWYFSIMVAKIKVPKMMAIFSKTS